MNFSHLKLFMAIVFGGCLLLPGQSGCAPRDEMPPIERDRFVEMDTNGDGKVVIEEFSTANPNLNDQAFIIIDSNGDKSIDRIEWESFSKNHGRRPQEGARMNNIPGDPLIPPPDSSDLPLMRPPMQ